jgi:hypothetical protein
MDNKEEMQQFAGALALRVDELTVWAISHWPDRQHPLTKAHFGAVRAAFAAIAELQPAARPPGAPVPGPAAGGPQYIDSNPAPWP